ncbi:NUDIX domain-containing protein [Pseudodesulfovibrio sp. JC047]|uniref:NUDIX hydrolase n=1 Tax=Pseudodesulfovibrio sp. JC047 TaxID=2683199 RepID=UPI0013D507C3|nr:NUDIX domain-containing protein [Pseudodesulfovibrio sp. JC047]NDV19120.1 NUDIX domain-containing protein [Pseudodesulfovibrio sp. JC047]
MIFNKKPLGTERDTQPLEVVDAHNRPLAVLPKTAIHRQLLKHRSVQVIVLDPVGKIFLQKRNTMKPFFPGRWDISVRTHPRAGEASYDAGLRALKNELNLDVERLQFLKELPAGPETGFEHISLYTVPKNTHPITPNPDEVAEGFYYSQEELNCLIKEFRELLTPNLVVLWETGLLATL